MKTAMWMSALVMLAAPALTVSASADPGADLLGEVDLRDAKDWDLVRLPPCGRSGNTPVTKLGVRVTKHPAEIDRLEVTYYNGQEQELSVRHRFAPGSESRWIDLSGDARCIRTIRIVGDTESLGWRPGKQAHVAFYGKGPGAGPVRTVTTANAELGRLGSVRLTDAKDWDALVLPACAGSRNEPVNSLKVRVNDHHAQIDRLVVTYQNGGKEEIQLRKRFAPGSESIWHDLRGPARCIASIRVVGDTDSIGWRPGKQAEVVFWGKAR